MWKFENLDCVFFSNVIFHDRLRLLDLCELMKYYNGEDKYFRKFDNCFHIWPQSCTINWFLFNALFYFLSPLVPEQFILNSS